MLLRFFNKRKVKQWIGARRSILSKRCSKAIGGTKFLFDNASEQYCHVTVDASHFLPGEVRICTTGSHLMGIVG